MMWRRVKSKKLSSIMTTRLGDFGFKFSYETSPDTHQIRHRGLLSLPSGRKSCEGGKAERHTRPSPSTSRAAVE